MSRRLIRIVTPEPPSARRGNTITAARWERMLGQLGFEVVVEQSLDGPGDALVALHARRSADSVARWVKDCDGPVIVALTGTDLYGDLARGNQEAVASVHAATRLVVLQARALDALDAELRDRARVIHQSTTAPEPLPERVPPFRVCVVGHMRDVKDPFRAAEAVRLLGEDSPVYVVQIGSAADKDIADRARAEQRDSPRYEWLGPQPRDRALREIARSQLVCLSSRMEGGANVVTEAIACRAPVVSSRIDGSLGLLGDDYPGYFDVGDTEGLAALLQTVSTDGQLYAELERRCQALAHLADPAAELEAWRSLMHELCFL